jgi:hypothetical protein
MATAQAPEPARPRVHVQTRFPSGNARPVWVRLTLSGGGTTEAEVVLSVKEAQDLASALTKAADAGTRGSAFARSVYLGREAT